MMQRSLFDKRRRCVRLVLMLALMLFVLLCARSVSASSPELNSGNTSSALRTAGQRNINNFPFVFYVVQDPKTDALYIVNLLTYTAYAICDSAQWFLFGTSSSLCMLARESRERIPPLPPPPPFVHYSGVDVSCPAAATSFDSCTFTEGTCPPSQTLRVNCSNNEPLNPMQDIILRYPVGEWCQNTFDDIARTLDIILDRVSERVAAFPFSTIGTVSQISLVFFLAVVGIVVVVGVVELVRNCIRFRTQRLELMKANEEKKKHDDAKRRRRRKKQRLLLKKQQQLLLARQQQQQTKTSPRRGDDDGDEVPIGSASAHASSSLQQALLANHDNRADDAAPNNDDEDDDDDDDDDAFSDDGDGGGSSTDAEEGSRSRSPSSPSASLPAHRKRSDVDDVLVSVSPAAAAAVGNAGNVDAQRCNSRSRSRSSSMGRNSAVVKIDVPASGPKASSDEVVVDNNAATGEVSYAAKTATATTKTESNSSCDPLHRARRSNSINGANDGDAASAAAAAAARQGFSPNELPVESMRSLDGAETDDAVARDGNQNHDADAGDVGAADSLSSPQSSVSRRVAF